MEAAIHESARDLGYDKLKDKQKEAVVAFLQGNDTFVSLPTGYGKSVIFAILPGAFDKYKGKYNTRRACLDLMAFLSTSAGTSGSIVVCISPLTSLMMDQHAKFTPRGLQTEFVGEGQTNPQKKDKVLRGEVQLVYISPESAICNRTYRNMFLSSAYKERLVAVVVDEAHCVKTWGDEFRTAFAHIGELRSLIPSRINILALTATATSRTLNIVTQRLSMVHPTLVALPPYRDNISYTVHQKTDLDIFTTSLCHELSCRRLAFPKTIIYVRTYTDCIDIYLQMKTKMGHAFTEPPTYPNAVGFRLVDMFTRVLTSEKKDEVLASFSQKKGTLRVVIATTAFGMGVDCPDIYRIIHWGMPATLEEYVQETGRAGRDGEPSEAVLYKGKGPRKSTAEALQYESNMSICRRRLLFKNFFMYSESDMYENSSCCDICKSP